MSPEAITAIVTGALALIGSITALVTSRINAELVAELSLAPIRPDEVTSVMLAEATGLTAKAASSRLEKGVREGVLEWRWVRVGNCRAKAYRKAAL